MAYRFGIGDYATLRNYAESQLDIVRLSQVDEAMLSNFFNMEKAGQCPVVRNKKFKDEILEKIFRQDRDFDYGSLKPSPAHVEIEDARFPKCMCQEFYDSNRRVKVVSYYQIPDAQKLSEAMSEQMGMRFMMTPEMKRSVSEQIESQVKRMTPNLDSFMLFYGNWKHYGDCVLEPKSETFDRLKESLNFTLGCPKILDDTKGEIYLPHDATGFLLDQLF